MLGESAVRSLVMKLAGLLDDFNAVQRDMLNHTAVWPGHGFASCREFAGLGMSNDNAAMISPQSYESCVAPADVAAGSRWGGPVFHSCGNWERLINAVARVPGLRMVDAAFSSQTDPAPNDGEPFRDGFAGTGVVVNARIVGSQAPVMGRWNRALPAARSTLWFVPNRATHVCPTSCDASISKAIHSR